MKVVDRLDEPPMVRLDGLAVGVFTTNAGLTVTMTGLEVTVTGVAELSVTRSSKDQVPAVVRTPVATFVCGGAHDTEPPRLL